MVRNDDGISIKSMKQNFVLNYVFRRSIIISSNFRKVFDLLYILIIYCVGAEIRTLMSISDGLGSYFFHRKMGKTYPMREEMDGKVFVSRQS